MGIPEREKRKRGKKKKMNRNFLNLLTLINVCIQEDALRIPSKINSKRSKLRHFIIKVLKAKDK